MNERKWAPGYRLGKLLGRGAFATVHEGTHIQTGKKVAVKYIYKGYVPNEQIYNEINILRSMPLNDYVINMIEAFDFEDKMVVIMDLAKDCGSLFDRVQRRGKYSEDIARVLITQLLEGIDFLHSHNIFHRDLKLDNVMFSNTTGNRAKQSDKEKAGELLITDFGLSAFLENGQQQVFMDKVGSPEYLAPEILKGKGYTKATDLWSLGVMGYFILSGQLPFYDNKKPVMYQMIVHGEPKFNDQLIWRKVSNAAKDFLSRLLEKDPKKRLGVRDAMLHPWIHGETGGYGRRKKPFLGPITVKSHGAPELHTQKREDVKAAAKSGSKNKLNMTQTTIRASKEERVPTPTSWSNEKVNSGEEKKKSPGVRKRRSRKDRSSMVDETQRHDGEFHDLEERLNTMIIKNSTENEFEKEFDNDSKFENRNHKSKSRVPPMRDKKKKKEKTMLEITNRFIERNYYRRQPPTQYNEADDILLIGSGPKAKKFSKRSKHHQMYKAVDKPAEVSFVHPLNSRGKFKYSETPPKEMKPLDIYNGNSTSKHSLLVYTSNTVKVPNSKAKVMANAKAKALANAERILRQARERIIRPSATTRAN
eukprot:Nk52_evm33s2309 gene=Nk52_evmTU33s2309